MANDMQSYRGYAKENKIITTEIYTRLTDMMKRL
jgi:hypothetical protein